MAKLDWNRCQRQSRQQTQKESDQISADFRTRLDLTAINKWAVKGRYFGQPLEKLPLKYLFWIIDNFSQDNIHKQRAEGELYRRYWALTDTQG